MEVNSFLPLPGSTLETNPMLMDLFREKVPLGKVG
jgi:hypothetical protein